MDSNNSKFKTIVRGLQKGGLPLLLSIAVHGFVVMLVGMNWSGASTPEKRMMPEHVQASLVELKEKPKAKPKKKTKTKAKPKPKAKPKKKPKPKKQIKPKIKEKPKPKPKVQDKPKPAPVVDLENELLGALDDEQAYQQAENDAALAASYHGKIKQGIEYHWSRPPSARRNMSVELAISLVPTGDVVAVSVIKSSGNEAFDRSAVNAVEKAGHFESLRDLPPRVFEEYFRNFKLRFTPEDLRK